MYNKTISIHPSITNIRAIEVFSKYILNNKKIISVRTKDKLGRILTVGDFAFKYRKPIKNKIKKEKEYQLLEIRILGIYNKYFEDAIFKDSSNLVTI